MDFPPTSPTILILFLSVLYLLSPSSLLNALLASFSCWTFPVLIYWLNMTYFPPPTFLFSGAHSRTHCSTSVRTWCVFPLMLIYCSSLFHSLSVMCLDVPCWMCKVSHNDRQITCHLKKSNCGQLYWLACNYFNVFENIKGPR